MLIYIRRFRSTQNIMHWIRKPGLSQEWVDKHITELEFPADGGDPARPRTIQDKKFRLKILVERFGTKNINEISKDDIQSVLDYTGAKGRDLRNYKTALQSFFNFVEKKCEHFDNIVAKFPQRKPKETKPVEIMESHQVKSFLNELESLYPESGSRTFTWLLRRNQDFRDIR